MNFSFGEILVILLVALLVIKPEQLPEVAYTLGRFAQNLRRMFGRIKEEMNELMDGTELSNNKKESSSDFSKKD